MCLLNHGKRNVQLKNKPFTKINEIIFLERALGVEELKVTGEDVKKPRPRFPSTFCRVWGCFSSPRRKKAKRRGVYSSVSLPSRSDTPGTAQGLADAVAQTKENQPMPHCPPPYIQEPWWWLWKRAETSREGWLISVSTLCGKAWQASLELDGGGKMAAVITGQRKQRCWRESSTSEGYGTADKTGKLGWGACFHLRFEVIMGYKCGNTRQEMGMWEGFTVRLQSWWLEFRTYQFRQATEKWSTYKKMSVKRECLRG